MSHHQVVIIGAGPAGLLLARLLTNNGIECLILENRNESFLKRNNRGGFLEYRMAQLLQKEKVGTGIQANGIPLSQINIHINGEQLPISFLEDKQAIIYDQRNIVADLLAGLKADGVPIIFEAKAQRYEGLQSEKVKIIYTLNGQLHEMTGDYIVGCDGFRGISRRTIPPALRNEKKEELPYAWLEWLVDVPPIQQVPFLTFNKNGFAMQTPSTNGKTRFYMQVKRGIEMDDLPMEKEIWADLENRLGMKVNQGEMLNRKLDYMRSFYTNTLQYGRLFIAGDAAHVVPRLGSKGLNMAFIDAEKLAKSLIAFYKNKNSHLLATYSERCLVNNLKTIEYTELLNQLFHIQAAVSFEDQLENINKFYKDENHKMAFVDYIVGS